MFIAIMVACGALGVALQSSTVTAQVVVLLHLPAWSDGILSGTGEALVIACVLGITVDRYTKRKMSQDLAKDTFRAVWGYGLPDSIQKETVESVIRQPIYRKNYLFDIYLERDPSVTGYLLSRIVARYDIVNLANRSVKHSVHAFVEKCRYEEALPSEIVAVSTRGAKRDLLYSSNVPVTETERGDLVFAKPITLPAAGETVSVTVVWTQYVALDDDHSLTLVHSTENVDLILHVPDDTWEGGVRFRHPDPDRFETHSPQNPYMWRKTGGFLPYQSAVVWWRPRTVGVSCSTTGQSALKSGNDNTESSNGTSHE